MAWSISGHCRATFLVDPLAELVTVVDDYAQIVVEASFRQEVRCLQGPSSLHDSDGTCSPKPAHIRDDAR